tara:strand:+ start:233 stop:1111 length:879 start_codon:yes stop_codon:yes gene_type:complete
MVESTGTEEAGPDQFIKLKESEVKKKYLEVAFQKGFIKIWNKGDKTFDFVLDSVHEGGEDGPIKVSLSLKNLAFDNDWKGEEVFIYFHLKKSRFFSKGKVEEIKEGESLEVTIEKDLYKLDQRKSKRLLTFPSHRVYAYIKLQVGNDGGVISLNRPKDHLHNFFKNFQKQVLESQFSNSTPLEKDFLEDYIGFRVLDLSNSGLSFLLNQIEADYFKKLKSDFKMLLNFSGRKESLEECKLSYLVPYVDPKLGNLSLFKLGLHFKEIEGLIDNPLEDDEEGGSAIRNFADFVK